MTITEQQRWNQHNVGKVLNTLAELEAKHLSTVSGPNGGLLFFYSINGRVIILQQYAEDCGLEVFTPLSESQKITDICAAIREYAEVRS